MHPIRRLIRSEQGAVFVQIGLAAFVLMAFNIFVLDYGMMWVARRQAQNAADAGALAGAVARGYDDFDDPPSPTGIATRSAEEVADANLIWNAEGAARVLYDCPAGVTGKCTRVEVYRNGEFGSSPLPTLFGPILAISSQGVRATATAITGKGNTTTCLAPWAFADDGDFDNRSPVDQFNRYLEPSASPGTVLSPADDYTPPSATQSGGTTVSVNFAELFPWTVGDPLTTAITRGLVVPLDLPGGNTFFDDMTECNGQSLELKQILPVDTALIPSIATEIRDATQALFDADPPPATWDNGAQRVTNSCAPGCAPVSPRLLSVALYDPDKYQLGRATGEWQVLAGCPTNNPCVTISNIVGFFVHCVEGRVCDGDSRPHGHFLKYPGAVVTTAPTYTDNGSWLVTTHLIR
jgi:hypothetical protein